MKFTKKSDVLFTENDVRDEIFRRAIINGEARKQAINASKILKTVEQPVQKTTTNPHAITLKKLDEILDKVSGYENTKITAIAELALALENGNFTNLITLLKKKDKVLKVKTKNYL